MAKLAKLLQAAAGAGGGGGLNIEDVFSTYLYEGNASTQAINNGIDLSGEGGLLWIKKRSGTASNFLFGSDRSADNTALLSNTTLAYYGTSYSVSHSSTGFTVPATTSGDVNESGHDYASWTFRKAPKFFDVVTWTGDGTDNRAIPHNLGTTVGCYFVKCTSHSTSSDWIVWHKDLSGNSYDLVLNTTAAEANYNLFSTTAPDSSNIYLGTGYKLFHNTSGRTYVAYLFAHNDGDGEFGPDGDADIIKCGSYTGNGSSDGQFIDLGFEPQWLLVKKSSAADNWILMDNMRGMVTSSPVYNNDDETLRPNTSGAEVTTNDISSINPTGFTIREGGNSLNSISATYIYIAIRRGPMAVPESADEVFKAAYGNASGEPAFTSGFPVDFGIWHGTISSSNENRTSTRLTQGKTLDTDSTAAEQTSTAWAFDYQDGFMSGGGGSSNFATMWRRAPNFFDVVAYTGTGSNQTISHNLGVAPKFMIVKERTTANNWVCYLEALGNDKRMGLNAASTVATDTTAWQSTTPTDSAFYVGANTQTNVSGEAFIAYLFGEVAGISKFGTYTGTGAAQNIDCGFSSGARFVLIKTYAGTNPNADWNIWDSERGIVAGNDPYLALSSASAEVTSTDVIDPYSSGFALTSSGVANNSGTSYWFYAIA